MKNFIFLILFGLSMPSLSAQAAHLGGTIDISLTKGKLNSEFVLSNLQMGDTHLSFMLHSDLRVKQITLNDRTVDFTPSSAACYDCKIYKVTLAQQIRPTDRLQIKTIGKFKNYKPASNKSDYKGRIANNYGILRASEQSKWYPVLISEEKNLPAFMRKFPYTLDLKATCDCKHIYIGRGVPLKSGSQFKSETPSKDLMLIAGDYNWFEGENATFINVEDATLGDELDALFSSITQYYEAFTGIEMPAKFVLANLPSDNSQWGGFMTYPTIVSVRKNLGNRDLAPYLSHEVAHYLFGDVYQAEGNLIWFYLESFAEYLSFKYLLAHQPKSLKPDYRRLKRNKKFVRLDQVKDFAEVDGTFRYLIGPFQLLALEQRIGEKKMLEFIATVFPKLSGAEDGYQALVESLAEIGIGQETIKNIEQTIFHQFDLATYKFVETYFPGE